MSDLVPITLPDDEHLKDDERWVRHLLEGTVGQTRVIDWSGGGDQERRLLRRWPGACQAAPAGSRSRR